MYFSRDITSKINWILDNLCPPILRDRMALMYPIYYLAYGKKTKWLMEYKEHYQDLTSEDYNEYYRWVSNTDLSKRPTDLNRHCIKYIFSQIYDKKESILDVGCGRGFLCDALADDGCFDVSGLDIISPKNTKSIKWKFYEGG